MCWSNPSGEGGGLKEEGLEFEVSLSPFVCTPASTPQYSEQLYIQLTPEFEVVWGPFVWRPVGSKLGGGLECCSLSLGNVQLNDYLCVVDIPHPKLDPLGQFNLGGLYKYDHYLVEAWLQVRTADSARKQFSSPTKDDLLLLTDISERWKFNQSPNVLVLAHKDF